LISRQASLSGKNEGNVKAWKFMQRRALWKVHFTFFDIPILSMPTQHRRNVVHVNTLLNTDFIRMV
jgi:hypothetical protein